MATDGIVGLTQAMTSPDTCCAEVPNTISNVCNNVNGNSICHTSPPICQVRNIAQLSDPCHLQSPIMRHLTRITHTTCHRKTCSGTPRPCFDIEWESSVTKKGWVTDLFRNIKPKTASSISQSDPGGVCHICCGEAPTLLELMNMHEVNIAKTGLQCQNKICGENLELYRERVMRAGRRNPLLNDMYPGEVAKAKVHMKEACGEYTGFKRRKAQ